MSSNQTPDPDAFRDFEHAGWTSNVSEYEAAFTRLTRQAVAPLLDAVNLRHGARLLDVATDRVMSRLPRPGAERGPWVSTFPLRWLRMPVRSIPPLSFKKGTRKHFHLRIAALTP